MTGALRLASIRGVHTAIYLVMATASFLMLHAGISGQRGGWLGWSAALIAVESVVFVGSGMKCPLTALATQNGADNQGVGDTYLPERWTRFTLRFFGPLIVIATAMLAGRFLWFGWA
jgi:hypothetical protein